MRKHDLQPTDDNIRSTFYNDSIGRNKDLVNFIKIINSINGSYSIALDSYWGSGKTFFVKQVKMILDAITEDSYCKVEGKKEILSKWGQISENLQIKKHVPIYYDAWQNDCDDDPIYSLIYQMTLDTENIKGLKDKINFNDVLNTAGKITGIVAGKLSEHLAGVNPNEIVEDLKKDDFLETLRARKDIDKRIEEYIDKLLPEGCDRLLIIIDELDRCNPEFAVKLLERIKHYFNNDKITFVFSVNLAELQHTIKHCYGVNFNAHRYLDRFFDLTIKLPKPDMDKVFPKNSIIKNAIEKLNIQMREIPKYSRLCSRIDGFSVKDNVELCCDTEDIPEEGCITENTNTVIKNIVIPYLLALIITDNKEYEAFFNGHGAEKFRTFLTEAEDDIINYIESVFVEEENSINTQIDEFYHHIIRDYSLDETEEDYKCFGYNYPIGKCIISGYEKRYLTRKIDEILQSMENWKILEEENNGQT